MKNNRISMMVNRTSSEVPEDKQFGVGNGYLVWTRKDDTKWGSVTVCTEGFFSEEVK